MDLSFNNLREIFKGVFLDIKNLKYLDLLYNKIKIVEENVFGGLFDLEEINLRFNEIKYLLDNLFIVVFLKLKNIFIDMNLLENIFLFIFYIWILEKVSFWNINIYLCNINEMLYRINWYFL